MNAEHSSPDEAPAPPYETRDVDLGSIALFGGGLLVMGLVVQVLLWLLFGFFNERASRRDPPASPLADRKQQVPEPRLQSHPTADYDAYRAAKQRELESYGWVDRRAGVVHIPIERAMELVLERGLGHAQKEPAKP